MSLLFELCKVDTELVKTSDYVQIFTATMLFHWYDNSLAPKQIWFIGFRHVQPRLRNMPVLVGHLVRFPCSPIISYACRTSYYFPQIIEKCLHNKCMGCTEILPKWYFVPLKYEHLQKSLRGRLGLSECAENKSYSRRYSRWKWSR